MQANFILFAELECVRKSVFFFRLYKPKILKN